MDKEPKLDGRQHDHVPVLPRQNKVDQKVQILTKEFSAMPKIKIKTHSGAKKRFNLTKNGKVKRAHANQDAIS